MGEKGVVALVIRTCSGQPVFGLFGAAQKTSMMNEWQLISPYGRDSLHSNSLDGALIYVYI